MGQSRKRLPRKKSSCRNGRNSFPFIAGILTAVSIISIAGGLIISQNSGLAGEDFDYSSCYITIDGALTPQSDVMSCSDHRCTYNDGSYCDEGPDYCYDPQGNKSTTTCCWGADGTPDGDWASKRNVDWTCRDASGNVVQYDQYGDDHHDDEGQTNTTTSGTTGGTSGGGTTDGTTGGTSGDSAYIPGEEAKCLKDSAGNLQWNYPGKAGDGWNTIAKSDCRDKGVTMPGQYWYAQPQKSEEPVHHAPSDQPKPEETKNTTVAPPTQGQCRNGEERNDGCNTCVCANGAWACTMRYCDKSDTQGGRDDMDNRRYDEDRRGDENRGDYNGGYDDGFDRQKEDWMRNVKDREREINNMQREADRSKNASMRSKIEDFKNAIQSLKSCVKSANNRDDMESCEELQWKIDDIQQGFWDAMQDMHREEQAMGMERQCEDLKREAKRMQHERVGDVRGEGDGVKADGMVGKVQQLVNKCQNIIADAKNKMNTGRESWEAEDDMRFAMEDLWREFEEIMRSQWEGQECRDAERGIKDATHGVEKEAPRMIEMLRRGGNAEAAQKMETLRIKAKTILDKARAAVSANNCESAFDILDMMRYEVEERAMRIMEETGVPMFDMDDDHMGRPPQFVDYDDDYGDFYDEFGFEDDFMKDISKDDFKRHMGERGYGMKDISMMKKMSSGVMEEFFTNTKDMGSENDLIRYASEAGMGDMQGLQEIIRVKNELIAEIKALKNQVLAIRSELSDIVTQFQQYNFGKTTGQKAKAFIKEELKNLSREEAVAKLEELKSEAREEKFDDGIIPFVDTDDNEWYATHAAKAKKLGFVQGTGESDGKRLDPARDTNVAEAIMMFARVNGLTYGLSPKSEIGSRLPSWASDAAGSLERDGVNLDEILGGKDPAEPVTRSDVARLLVEVLGLTSVDETNVHAFSDIDLASSEEKSAIAAVFDAGVMTGYGDSDRFGVNDPLNRAALVKILNLSNEIAE